MQVLNEWWNGFLYDWNALNNNLNNAYSIRYAFASAIAVVSMILDTFGMDGSENTQQWWPIFLEKTISLAEYCLSWNLPLFHTIDQNNPIAHFQSWLFFDQINIAHSE